MEVRVLDDKIVFQMPNGISYIQKFFLSSLEIYNVVATVYFMGLSMKCIR